MVRSAVNKPVSEIQNPVDEDGLTASEREYLSAPFSELSEQQRLTAMSIKEKQTRNRYAANEEYRRKQETVKEKLK